MRLRSGLTYSINVIYVKRKPTIQKISNNVDMICCICMEPYKKGHKITSCSKENIKKHNFHSECMKNHIKTTALMTGNSLGPFHCPYCMIKLNKFQIYTARKE